MRPCAALPLPWAPLLAPSDSWGLLAALSACAAGGAQAGKHTRLGRALSGPVCAMLLAWLAHAALGILPPPVRAAWQAGGRSRVAVAVAVSHSIPTYAELAKRSQGPHFAMTQLFCVQLATPALLLGADVRAILGRTRRLSGAFALGAAATTLGALAGFALLSPLLAPLGDAPGDGWKLAAALTAKNIGGGFNYVAVATTLGLSSQALAAGLVCDNVAGLIYFPLVSFLGRDAREPAMPAAAADGDAASAAAAGTPALEDTLTALALSCALTVAARALSPGNALPVATALTVLLATAAPGALRRVAPAGDALGAVLLYLFFATAGASAGDPARAAAYAPLLAFLASLYAVHLGVMLLLGRALGFSLPETLLASNANIGGPATAASMADAAGWASLRTPALLVGSLGNAVATFIGLALGTGVLRHM